MKWTTIFPSLGFVCGVVALAFAYQQSTTLQQRVDQKVAIEMVALEKEALAKAEAKVKAELLSDDKMQHTAERALRKREKELVRAFLPKFQRMFATSGEDVGNYTAEEVDTIEELVRPLIQMIKNLS